MTLAARILLIGLALFNIGRGLFHTFAPDGGAGTVAHLDLTTNAQNIIFLIATIGVHQIAIGLFQLLIAWRAQQLILAAYVIDLVLLVLPRFDNKLPASTFPGITAHNVELIVVGVIIGLILLAQLLTKPK